jgi:hypothetical protein
LLDHPQTVYLREVQLAAKLNGWIATLFSPENRDETVAILAGAQEGADPAITAENAFRQRIDAAKATMARCGC